jgi:sec-independent protein translocase protein TatB
MLDIGFSEIVLIFGLALVVLGPEKLPKVASQVGRWIGRARGMARQFREQLEEEVNLEEVRKIRPPVMTSDPPPAVPPPQVATTNPSPFVTPQVGTTNPASSVAPTDTPPAQSTPPESAESPSAAVAEAAPHAAFQPQAEPEQPVYPDGYSHSHPTDSLGRPIEQPTHESAAVDSGQQDWVGGVTASDKAAQTTPAAAYAPSHERGT